MGRNWSRKSIEEIAKQVAKNITAVNPSITVRGARDWGYPLDSRSAYNHPWAESYFMDIEIVEKGRELVTMYLPLPIFNGSINPDGFVDKGMEGVSYEYDPIKGQLAFIYNDGCEPTIYNPSDDNRGFLYRGLPYRIGDTFTLWRPLRKLPRRNHAMSKPNVSWKGTVTLYKAKIVAIISTSQPNRPVIKLGDVISEHVNPKLSEFNVFRDYYTDNPEDVGSDFYPGSLIWQLQYAGYSNQALQHLEAPKTDEWKHYNITGTTYAFNADKSSSVAITGRGLPAAAVSSFSNRSTLTHKIYVSGTLLNDLLFTQEYDVWKKDNGHYDYVDESAVLKISFKL